MGEMFNDLFDVVVMVQLRDPDVHSAQSLVELLPRSPSDPGMVAKAMLKAEGEKSLVIYDGLDELPISVVLAFAIALLAGLCRQAVPD